MNAKNNIELPAAGRRTVIPCGHNPHGKITLSIKNWKGMRYYLTLAYRSARREKSREIGWVAADGSDWKLRPDSRADDILQSLYSQIGGAVAE